MRKRTEKTAASSALAWIMFRPHPVTEERIARANGQLSNGRFPPRIPRALHRKYKTAVSLQVILVQVNWDTSKRTLCPAAKRVVPVMLILFAAALALFAALYLAQPELVVFRNRRPAPGFVQEIFEAGMGLQDLGRGTAAG